jgi:hypothetical protein
MSIQNIVDTATSIEINRSKLVAQSISRSGRLLTATRNWANPYRFVITPKPIWSWDTTTQGIFGVLFDNDRHIEDSFYLSQTSGGPLEWMTSYKGTLDATNNDVLDDMTVASEPTGASITMTYAGNSATNAGRYIVRKGDWIRPTDHRYPYQATADQVIINGTTSYTISVHRGWIAQSGYTAAGKTVQIGDAAARFYVQVTKLPQMRFINKNFVELTDNIELIEVVL